MTRRHPRQTPARRIAAGVLAAAGLMAAAPAFAQADPGAADPSMVDDGAARLITVPKDKSAAFHLDYPASEIVVAQPDMVQLVATTDRSFYIRGKALGVTNLLIYDHPHHLAQVIDVRVGRDTEALQHDLAAALPGERIVCTNMADGVLLTGTASTPAVAARAKAIAERYAPQAVSSNVTISADQQVMVEVRIMEVSKSSLKDIGFNIDASSSDGNFSFQSGTLGGLEGGLTPQGVLSGTAHWGNITLNAKIAALENQGLIRTLAKPNLVAMSGEEASFLAGGEFPYPVPGGLNEVTIEFRQFGVKLNVTPVVQDNGEIKLKIAPEVSQLDYSHAVKIDSFVIPALASSKAATTVQLKDGQSFAIAGLYQHGYTNAMDQIPGLSNLPVLGALFRSSNWQHQQTELAIIVTPHLSTPVDNIDKLPNPLIAHQEPSAIDLILMGMVDKDDPPGAKSVKR